MTVPVTGKQAGSLQGWVCVWTKLLVLDLAHPRIIPLPLTTLVKKDKFAICPVSLPVGPARVGLCPASPSCSWTPVGARQGIDVQQMFVQQAFGNIPLPCPATSDP